MDLSGYCHVGPLSSDRLKQKFSVTQDGRLEISCIQADIQRLELARTQASVAR
jgi:hypothetical protein